MNERGTPEGLMLGMKQGFPAEVVPVSAYVGELNRGSSKNLKDLKDLKNLRERRDG